MTLEFMCSGSLVERLQKNHQVGELGGDTLTFTSTGGLACNAQTMSAQEAKQYDARGERRMWNLYFPQDPDLTPDQWVRLTWQQGRTLPAPKLLHVLASEFEGNPEGDLALWVVRCEEITTRFDVVT